MVVLEDITVTVSRGFKQSTGRQRAPCCCVCVVDRGNFSGVLLYKVKVFPKTALGPPSHWQALKWAENGGA